MQMARRTPKWKSLIQEAILRQKATAFDFEQCIQVQGLFTEACLNTFAIATAHNYDVLT